MKKKEKKKRILFIEDEIEFIMMIKMRLEASNYEVIPAYNGEEGLNRAQKEKVDLILLDIIIPKIDGLTLCKRLKGDSKTKNIPIIIFTASGGTNLAEECKKAGANDVVTKPFEPKDLLDKIAQHLEK